MISFSLLYFQSMRESEYSKTLDANFKKFLNQRKGSRTEAEEAESRAGALLGESLEEDVKDYTYVIFMCVFLYIYRYFVFLLFTFSLFFQKAKEGYGQGQEERLP